MNGLAVAIYFRSAAIPSKQSSGALGQTTTALDVDIARSE